MLRLIHFSVTRTLILGIAAAAAASSAFILQSPSAQAACLTGTLAVDGTNCKTFTKDSSSDVIDGAYSDTVFLSNSQIDEVKFYQNGFTGGLPLTITNIAISVNDGASFTSLPDFTLSSTDVFSNIGSITNLLTSPIISPTNQVRLTYTIPTTVALSPNARSITSWIQTSKGVGTDDQFQTRAHQLVATPPPAAPGPLPIMGAGAAFAYSRRMRKRVRLAA